MVDFDPSTFVPDAAPKAVEIDPSTFVPDAPPKGAFAGAKAAGSGEADQSASPMEYAGAALKGAAHAIGIPTSVPELKDSLADAAMMATFPPAAMAKQVVDAVKGGVNAISAAKDAPTTAGAIAKGIGAVPIVGPPASAVLQPAVATLSEGRPPTKAENLGAVSGASGLATLGVGALLAPGEAKESEPIAEPPTSGIPDVAPLPAAQAAPEFDPSTFVPDETPHAESMNPVPIPQPAQAVEAAKSFAPLKEFIDGIAPASASETAGKAAGILRDAKAQIANNSAIESYANRDSTKFFDKVSDGDNVANISSYEQTGKFASEPSPGYSAFFKKSMDASHDQMQEAYGEDRVGYVENYVRRAFRFGSKADEAEATPILTNAIGSLSADKSPLKGRVLDMPLDQALKLMKDRGIDVEPVTTNPELLRQWTVENAKQALVYRQAWDEAKSTNLVQFAKTGTKVPDGLVPLDDRVAKVFFPSEAGLVKGGQYYADPNVARIFNNAISKGLGDSATYRGFRTVNNAMNQVQLGLSGFHLTGTAINAGVSDLALSMERLAGGDVTGAASAAARSAALGPVSFMNDMLKGRKFINDLVAGDPVAKQFLEEKFNPAGGRLKVDQAYTNTAERNMMRAWKNGQYGRAAANVPLALVQKVASPLMGYAIPRVKAGAFLDLAEAKLARLAPSASESAREAAYRSAWDSIDNRFGQIVHDNLFWNKVARDLTQVSLRSVGWNLGTIRELGGGLADIPAALSGKGVSSKLLYTAALPIYAGTIGALYQYLHTGQAPQELKDYLYPKNGLRDQRGNADRVALPTYMKDVYAYSTHPVQTIEHKASPLVSMGADLMTNRDYAGDMVKNPEDSGWKQFGQVLEYLVKSTLPFSVQQAAQSLGEGKVGSQSLENMAGFTRAPGEIRQSQEQQDAASKRRQSHPHTPLTPEQRERRDRKNTAEIPEKRQSSPG